VENRSPATGWQALKIKNLSGVPAHKIFKSFKQLLNIITNLHLSNSMIFFG
jgi:hypothetical protein